MTPARFFFDTEFLNRSGGGVVSLRLTSLGMAAEDGRELYRENSAFDWGRVPAGDWLLENVRPHLQGPGSDAWSEPAEMARDLREFVGDGAAPEFWAYNGASDWLVLLSLFGDLLDRPSSWPSRHHELKDAVAGAGLHRADLPGHEEGTAHHALADARWNLAVWRHLGSLA